jgi:hypothetical protein
MLALPPASDTVLAAPDTSIDKRRARKARYDRSAKGKAARGIRRMPR